jgi:AraC-like DNA-binding protein
MGGNHDRASGPLASAAEDLAWPSTAGTSAPAAAESPGADALSDVLEAVRLTGALFFIVEASPPWIAESPDSSVLAPVILPRVQHVVSYHVVTEGTCWCHMAGAAPVRLDAGDVVVIPHGDAYWLSSDPDMSASGFSLEQILAWFRMMASGELPFVVEEVGAGPERLRVICGFLGCDGLPFNPVLATLPRLLPVRGALAAGGDRLAALVEFAVGESREKRAGSRSVLLRLGELMFVEVVRRHLVTLPEAQRGWLAGLRDPLVGRALARLHKQPARSWTLDELAREVATSRSVLVERFAHFVGEPPMHYLARWRMHLAATLLSDNAAKVSAVAREVGYDSEAAFSRAFKKLTGVAPAGWRHRQAPPSPQGRS